MDNEIRLSLERKTVKVQKGTSDRLNTTLKYLVINLLCDNR